MRWLSKIKSWFKSNKTKCVSISDWSDVLLEIAHRLETSNYDPNTTRFERYNLAVELTEKYYKSEWCTKSYDDFDGHITQYLNEQYPAEYIKPYPILLTNFQCVCAILISGYLMDSLYVKLGWNHDDIMSVAIQLAVNFQYDSELYGKCSLNDQINSFMESSKALQIAEEYASHRNLKLVEDV